MTGQDALGYGVALFGHGRFRGLTHTSPMTEEQARAEMALLIPELAEGYECRLVVITVAG